MSLCNSPLLLFLEELGPIDFIGNEIFHRGYLCTCSDNLPHRTVSCAFWKFKIQLWNAPRVKESKYTRQVLLVTRLHQVSVWFLVYCRNNNFPNSLYSIQVSEIASIANKLQMSSKYEFYKRNGYSESSCQLIHWCIFLME